MRCKRCEKIKTDVEVRINPYMADVEGVELKEPLCDECYELLTYKI